MIVEEITSVLGYYKLLNQYGMYEGILLEGIKDLIVKRELPNNIFYRGQNARYSSIICGLPREKGFCKNEYAMYTETLSTKWDDFKSFELPIEYLSKMQHYGMPTRLVDFTINPFIALFFAVQNDLTFDDAIVYIYKDCGIDISDDRVKILSLLPTLKEKSLEELKDQIEKVFGLVLSKQEIAETINNTYYINFTDRLKESNVRLNHQDGTFAICGNAVENGIITDQPCGVDTEKSCLTIKIPHQYKVTIKKELDLYFKINDNFIYPELTAWSDYIKEKYKRLDFNINGAFSIVRNNDISLPEIKRAEIKIVLNKEMNDENIKSCVRQMLNDNIEDYQMVWFYVATNGENYNVNNWIKTGQWIAPTTPESYSQVSFDKLDSDNIFWEDSSAFATREEYNRNNLFRDDKEVFILFHHSFQILYPVLHSFEYGYEVLDYENFCDEVNKREHLINEMCNKVRTFGRSKDIDFDSFIFNYIDFFIAMSDLTHWVKLPNIDSSWLDYRINNCFKTIHTAINQIQESKEKWMNAFDVKAEDFKNCDFKENIKETLKYRQSIPVSPNARKVNFSLLYSIDNSNFFINGKTNLFDGAVLDLTLSLKYGEIFHQQTATIKNGEFEFVVDRKKMVHNNYEVFLSLPFPRRQPIVFIDKAGEEYQYLDGDYIIRQGIDSTLTYKDFFNIYDVKNISEELLIRI